MPAGQGRRSADPAALVLRQAAGPQTRAGALMPAQTLVLQRTVGNRATAGLAAPERRLDRQSEREFAEHHPLVALELYNAEQPAEVAEPSNSSLAVRFSVNLRTDRQQEISKGGLTENAKHEGSEVNAMRHVLWNILNTLKYGRETAEEAASAHEAHPDAIKGQDPDKQVFQNLEDVDEATDLRNNIIGRSLGAALKSNSEARIDSQTKNRLSAKTALEAFHKSGFWVAELQKDGKTYKAVIHRLSDATYDAAKLKLANLSERGLTPDGEARWRAARDFEQHLK